MKTYPLFLYLFLNLFLSVTAQNEEVDFESKYLPNKEYSLESKISASLKTTKNLNKEIQKEFDSVGITRIIKHKNTLSFKGKLLTGKIDSLNYLPVKLYGSDFKYNGTSNKNNEQSDSLEIIGRFNKNNELTVEQIFENGESINPGQINHLFTGNDFLFQSSKHHLKVGDSFEVKSSIIYNVPLEGPGLFDYIFLITLKKVKKNVAFFDISLKSFSKWHFQNIEMYSISADGVIQYDINKHFMKKFKLKHSIYLIETIDDGFNITHNFSENFYRKTVLN